MIFEAYGQSISGGMEYQEDSWSVSTSNGPVLNPESQDEKAVLEAPFLALVADGIGGGGNGDIASAHVAQRFAECLFERSKEKDRFRDAINQVDVELADLKSKRSEFGPSMGSTLVSVLFDGKDMEFASVGDSLIYRFRDGEVHFVNELHEHGMDLDEQSLLGIGDIQQVQADPKRASITSAIVGMGVQKIQNDRRTVMPGDTYILASDGIELLAPELLRRIVGSHKSRDIEALVGAIVRMADVKGNFRGGNHDNCTVVAVRCFAKTSDLKATAGSAESSGKTVPLQVPSSDHLIVDEPTEKPRLFRNSQSRLLVWLAGFLLVLIGAAFWISGFWNSTSMEEAGKKDNLPKVSAPATDNGEEATSADTKTGTKLEDAEAPVSNDSGNSNKGGASQ